MFPLLQYLQIVLLAQSKQPSIEQFEHVWLLGFVQLSPYYAYDSKILMKL